MLVKNLNGILIVFVLVLVFISIYIIKMDSGVVKSEQTVTVKETEYQKNLYIGITNYDILNPIKTKSMDIFYLSKLAYKPILDIDKNFNLIPAIALECSKITDIKYILTLNKDLFWHDGEKILAEDIIYTIQVIKENKGVYYNNVKNILEINKIDDSTIEIILAEKQRGFEYMLTIPVIKQNEYNSEVPTTSGAYSIKEVNESNIIFENENNEEGFNKILINIYENPAKLYSAINKNEIDLLITENINVSKYISTIGNSITKISGRDYIYIKINTEDQILKNKEIRQALSYAIDKMDLNYKLFNNEMIITNNFFEDVIKIDYDFADKNKAMDLINNKKVHLEILVEDSSNYEIAKILKFQLKNIGIELDIKKVYNLEDYINKKEYQLAIINKKEDITKSLLIFFEDDKTEISRRIELSQEIENIELYQEKTKEILEENNEEVYNITLLRNPIYLVHSSLLQGDFSGNWYNVFYNINNWYKNEKN